MSLEQILPLIFFILLFAILRWFQRDPANTSQDSVDSSSSPKSSEESLRRVREVLGLPEDIIRSPWVLPDAPPPESSAFEPPLPLSPKSSRPNTQALHKQTSLRVKTPVERTQTIPLSHWLKEFNSLRDPNFLQRAIVLREVLGPPKSLE